MDRLRRTGLARTWTLVALAAFAGVAGWVTSALAAGTMTVPGTTITVPTKDDGTVDLSGVNLVELFAGMTLPSGMKLPADVVLPGGITLPKGFSVPNNAVPTQFQGTPTSGATTPTPSTLTLPPSTPSTVTTPVTPTTTAPTGAAPATAVPGLLGALASTTTTTTTAVSNDRDDRLATLLLVIVGGALLAAAIAFALARALGAEPDWWRGRRHQTAEAAWRTSNTWADFGDWVRRKN